MLTLEYIKDVIKSKNMLLIEANFNFEAMSKVAISNKQDDYLTLFLHVATNLNVNTIFMSINRYDPLDYYLKEDDDGEFEEHENLANKVRSIRTAFNREVDAILEGTITSITLFFIVNGVAYILVDIDETIDLPDECVLEDETEELREVLYERKRNKRLKENEDYDTSVHRAEETLIQTLIKTTDFLYCTNKTMRRNLALAILTESNSTVIQERNVSALAEKAWGILQSGRDKRMRESL